MFTAGNNPEKDDSPPFKKKKPQSDSPTPETIDLTSSLTQASPLASSNAETVTGKIFES